MRTWLIMCIMCCLSFHPVSSKFEFYHDEIQYTFNNDYFKYYAVPDSSLAFYFRVRTEKDAHLILSTSRSSQIEPYYEIVIGGWGNRWSTISKSGLQGYQVEYEKSWMVSGKVYLGFWIRWNIMGPVGPDGNISRTLFVGSEGQNWSFMKWKDTHPFTVRYVGIASRNDVDGTWEIETCNTRPNYVVGCHDCSRSCKTVFGVLEGCYDDCQIETCICKKGFIYSNKAYKCVESEECDCNGEVTATPGCLDCEITCYVLQGKSEPNCPPCDPENPGCKCKRGYVRDTALNVCVKAEKCSCDGDPNAKIGCSICQTECDTLLNPPNTCVEVCTLDGCICRDGYAYDSSKKKCVIRNDCSCNGDLNAFYGCASCLKKCETYLDPPTSCVRGCTVDACICRDGYFYDSEKKKCLVLKDCICDGDQNAFYGCSGCAKVCTNIFDPLNNCKVGCKVDACICRNGYYYDTEKEMCVPTKECPCNGDKNAIVGCSPCLKKCDAMFDPLTYCVSGCFMDMCICREGYFYYKKLNKCVAADVCPCDPDPNATPGCQTCEHTCNMVYGKPETRCTVCNPDHRGCKCKIGYAKDITRDRCVKSDDCSCDEDSNAVYGCGDCAKKCDTMLDPPKNCTKGCALDSCNCRDGYFYDSNKRKCVVFNDCTCNGDPHTVYGCSDCSKECDTMLTPRVNCWQGCTIDACNCRHGYFYDSKKNKCVVFNDCTCNGDPNAVYGCVGCGKVCTNIFDPMGNCTAGCNVDACNCRDGFYYDVENNLCVTAKDCPCNGDKNAVVGCHPCLKKCETMFSPLTSCVDGCAIDTCVCIEGYFYHELLKKCVESDVCPCGPDPNATPGCQTCELTCNIVHGKPETRCTECIPARPGCKCKIGFTKDITRGKCVESDDCSCDGDPNAIFGCSPCMITCERMFEPDDPNCEEGCTVDGCICREDFYYNSKSKKCVKDEECGCDVDDNSTPGCQDCDQTCNVLQGKIEMKCPPCDLKRRGCKCRRGYVKDTTRAICVRSRDCSCDGDPNAIIGCTFCSKMCDRMYEPLTNCTKKCTVESCICRSGFFWDDNIKKCVPADDCPGDDDPNSTPGCQDCGLSCNAAQGLPEPRCPHCGDNSTAFKCKIGFLKDYTRDICVRTEDCSCDGDPNAIFGCSLCSKKCYIMYDTLRRCKKGCTIDTCICRDGYYKETLTNKCVEADGCPCYPDLNATPGCQDCELTCNAVYNIPETHCEPCDNNSTSCKCKVGYVKDYTRDVCSRPENCSCNGDPNAVFGCHLCSRNCFHVLAPLRECLEGCIVDMCICKDGYFYDTTKNKCVEANDCPCSDDPNATHGCQSCEDTCSAVQDKLVVNCTECDHDYPGCKCKNGYYKDTSRDICVRREDCSCNGDPNAVFGCSVCAHKCVHMFDPLKKCKEGCFVDTCICREGFFYNTKTNRCVEANDCPCDSDPNATPGCQDCTQTCDALYGLLELNCLHCDNNDTACKCKVGYVKDSRRKVCVKREDCSCGPDPNAVQGCQDCDETCNVVYGQTEYNCMHCDLSAVRCMCKSGYIKDTTRGICVKKEDCSCDGDPNSLYGCLACEKECETMFDPLEGCTDNCTKDACICRDGYFYEINQRKCIKPEECPCGEDPNATPGCQDCNLTCEASHGHKETKCSPCDSEDPGCRCKLGYLMDTLFNVCVKHDNCSCGSDPKAENGCQDCEQTCYALNGEPDTGQCLPCDEDRPGCKCSAGYVMDTTRHICVQREDCSCNGDPNAVSGCIHCLIKCRTMFVPIDKNCQERCHKDHAFNYCICREGFYLDKIRMSCVVAEECPCGGDPNATPGCQDCAETCNALWDSEKDVCQPCDRTNPGCKCRSGYVKDTVRNMCVKSEHCSCSGDPNAIVGCSVCSRECDTMFELLENCTLECTVDSCICREGYLYDKEKNECLESEECSCGPDPHATPGCQECDRTCNALYGNPNAKCPPCDAHHPGCKCKAGYVKDTRWDMCVRARACSCNDDPHAVHGCQDCRLACSAEGDDAKVRPVCPPCDLTRPGCRCEEGYVMDVTADKCVRRNDCSCNGDPNAVVGCISCLIECATVTLPRVRKCQERCPAEYAFDFCICRAGYYLHTEKGRCVKVEECPCGGDPHAMPGSQDCKLTCNSSNGTVKTDCSSSESNQSMCKCKDGYVKDLTRDMCVKDKDCSCNEDPNAVYGCLECSSTCDRMFDPLENCTRECAADTCICRAGYFNDTKTNRCVEADGCPCGEDPYGTPGCHDCNLTCEALHGQRDVNCSTCESESVACKCKAGFVRDNRLGICVRSDECSCGPDPNGVYGCQDCAQTCDALTGQNETRCSPCDAGNPGCKCKVGWVKDTRTNSCVLREDCFDYKASMRLEKWSAPIIGLSLAGGMFVFGSIFSCLWYWFQAIKPAAVDAPLTCKCEDAELPSTSNCTCGDTGKSTKRDRAR